MAHKSYWQTVWMNFKKRPVGLLGLAVLMLFFVVALYAPFLASSKPLVVVYDDAVYFPLFRYLFSSVFYSKKIDLFFNLLGLFLPLIVFIRIRSVRFILLALFVGLFFFFAFFKAQDPASSPYLNQQKAALVFGLENPHADEPEGHIRTILPSWDVDLEYMNSYAKLNLVLDQYNKKRTHEDIVQSLSNSQDEPYTLYYQEKSREQKELTLLKKRIEAEKADYIKNCAEEELLEKSGRTDKLLALEEQTEAYEEMENRLQFIKDRRSWLTRELGKIRFIVMPLFSNHHWEDDVGGEQALNIKMPFTKDTRINRKDLLSALIFGCRISLFVGFGATLLALGIGVPLGLISGYYGAKIDLFLSRFVEVWEAMPVFFMLLLVVSILQTKSIFVVIAVISVFSWMGSFRFVRAETFRQRKMLYVDASKAVGFPDRVIILRHIMPNSILAVLALLPFDIMAAVTREAALAFLGLGEEQSCSWGVLMDEGRAAFPADSNLLWPPAIVLTILLVAIAFCGQALHGAMDPKSEE